MSIFNSLGSNYDFKFTLSALFGAGESNLKKFLEEKYGGEAILLFKGREAITFALESLNLPKNSAVAFTGFTCYAVYKAIEDAGLRPVLIDINESLNFSADELNKTVKNFDVKVLIIQNTLGYPCNIDEILKICKEKNIILVEDLAHSIGAIYKNGKEAGYMGDFAVFSFSQDKIVDGVSGGALMIRNRKFQNRKIPDFKNSSFRKRFTDRLYPILTLIIRSTYDFGIGKILHYIFKILNLLSEPMDDSLYGLTCLPNSYQNLIGESLNNLSKDLAHRRKIAKIYKENLNPKILSEKITSRIDISANLRFPIFVNKRGDLIKYLKSKKIYLSDIWYDSPIAPERFMTKIDYPPAGRQGKNGCPNSEKISKTILNLPTHKNISEREALYLSQLINLWGGRA